MSDETLLRAAPVIAVTRAAAQSHELVAAIERLGAVARNLPLVVMAPPADATAFAAAVAELSRYEVLVFTSQNAVAAFVAATAMESRRACHGKLVACVGAATAFAAGRAHLVVGAVPSLADAATLARDLAPRIRGKRVLLPQSDRADASLESALRAAGAQVVAVVAYRTVVAPLPSIEEFERALLRDEIDAVTFAAGSAVDALCETIGAERARLCCRRAAIAVLGRSAAASLESLGLRPDEVATETSMEALARAALDAIASRRRERS